MTYSPERVAVVGHSDVRFRAEFGRLRRVQGQQMLGGRYKLLNELGSGGMAVVWRARDEVLGRPVAVKFLDGRYANDPYSRSRIRDEARAAANLSPHPHIAQVYDFGESETGGAPIPYVVMELVNGHTLQQRLANGGLPPRSVFRICGEVASALAAAHADGLVHRDIKPANVMVTASGAKVVDFGLAAAAGRDEPEEVVVGTPAYLAPERLTDDVVEPASDVYALGVLLYRLLAGKSPWSVDSTTQMLSAHVYLDPAPLAPLSGVPMSITDLVNRCLRKYPADRPTAAEAAALLADAAERFKTGLRDGPGALLVRRSAAGMPWWDDNQANGAAAAAFDPAEKAREVRHAGAALVPVNLAAGKPDRASARRRRRTLALAAGGVLVTAIAALLVWLVVPDRADSAGNAGRTVAAGLPTTTATNDVGPTGRPTPEPTGGSAGARGIETSHPATAGGTPEPTASVPTGGPPTTPAGTAPPTTPQPSATTEPHTKTLTSPGGSVVARCARGRARLLSWTPARSYTVARINTGPALIAFITFADVDSKVRMNVTCASGQPTATIVYR